MREAVGIRGPGWMPRTGTLRVTQAFGYNSADEPPGVGSEERRTLRRAARVPNREAGLSLLRGQHGEGHSRSVEYWP